MCPPFGHAIPNWDFEIVEHPQPGQYRWLQFAWKALSPNTTAMALLIGATGRAAASTLSPATTTGDRERSQLKKWPSPAQQWQVVRVDLWELLKKPLRIQCLQLAAAGGGAAFDQLVLGRSEADLPVGGR